jgi:hypothetical protein
MVLGRHSNVSDLLVSVKSFLARGRAILMLLESVVDMDESHVAFNALINLCRADLLNQKETYERLVQAIEREPRVKGELLAILQPLQREVASAAERALRFKQGSRLIQQADVPDTPMERGGKPVAEGREGQSGQGHYRDGLSPRGESCASVQALPEQGVFALPLPTSDQLNLMMRQSSDTLEATVLGGPALWQ